MLPGKLSEYLGVVSQIDPAVIADTPVFGDEVDMSAFDQIIAIFQLGAVDKTVDCSIYEDTDGAAGSAQSLIACTQLTAGDDNKQVIINCRRDQLTEGFRYIRPRIVCGAAQAAPLSCVVLGYSAYQPAVTLDLASVAEIKEA